MEEGTPLIFPMQNFYFLSYFFKMSIGSVLSCNIPARQVAPALARFLRDHTRARLVLFEGGLDLKEFPELAPLREQVLSSFTKKDRWDCVLGLKYDENSLPKDAHSTV
jgi:hypothetical protein